MGDGVELGYDVDGLRTAASGLHEVAGRSDAAGSALQAAAVEPAMFGLTAGAAAFAAARTAQARGFRQEAGRAGDLGARGDATAGLGDDLTAQSTSTARTATPGTRAPR